LTDQELEECNIAVTIPSSEDSPSLNLAQAVQVITYSIFRLDFEGKGYTPIDSKRMSQVIKTVSGSLGKIDFFKKNEKNELESFFSDIFARAGISQSESVRIEKTILKLTGIKNTKT
jgi:tRNA/rRNA methyltransferase